MTDIELQEGITPVDVDAKILDQWQELVDSVAILLAIPAALIMRLNEKKIEVFRTSNSKGNPYKLFDNEVFFDSGLYCETVIRTDKKLYVADALKDPDWKDNPDVSLNMISYLGYPLKNSDSTPFGTLCILDDHYRKWTTDQEKVLVNFRNMIESHLDLINKANELRVINTQIAKSIEFASLIQHSIIPKDIAFKNYFTDHFVVWEPKDVVGGDIYLFNKLRDENEYILFVIDCTGHGVAGSLVTMIVRSIERQIISSIKQNNDEVNTAEVLSIFNKEIKTMLNQYDESAISNVGFDGGIIYFNKNRNIIRYSGSNTPFYYIHNNEIKILKGDKYSVGYKKSDINYEYTQYEIDTYEGMRVFVCTDGYVDQLGGEKLFPYGKKRFKDTICASDISLEEQKDIMIKSHKAYQGEESRVDDLTLVGIVI